MRLDYIDNCDCLEGLKEIPDKSVDCVIADPPYFINMGHGGSSQTFKNAANRNPVGNGLVANRTFNDLNIVAPFYKTLFQELARVLNDSGHFYNPIAQQFLPVRNMLVWDKGGAPGSYYTYAHELVMFGTYQKRLLHAGGSNVVKGIKAFCSGAASTNGEKVHPTQKPVELIEKFIIDSTEPGAVILDPFMGSGTTAVAALRTGRRFIGFELDEQYHAIATKRVESVTDELLGL